MFETEVKLHGFLVRYAGRLVADLTDEQLTTQPRPGMNPPLWILGHLAIATDYTREMLGLDKVCPEAWHAAFGPGSRPTAAPGKPPTKAELVAAIEAGQRDVEAAISRVEPAQLDTPNPIEFLRKELPTWGELLAHLLTTHDAIHLGQLSAWRRAMGLSGV